MTKAFYFATNDKKLRYGDNRQIRVGTTHTVDYEPMLCRQGLHASRRLIDALSYAPGHWLYWVELGGETIEGSDKMAATSRKYLADFNAERLLRKFARKQALLNIEKIKPYCGKDDYHLILKWLNTGDKRYQAAARYAASTARYTANSTTHSTARSAAHSAAHCASYDAADAAYDTGCAAASAARSAADAAADAAAASTARSAAHSAAHCAGCAAYAAYDTGCAANSTTHSAAYDAADAARSAAHSAANKMLTDMVREATGWDIGEDDRYYLIEKEKDNE